MTPDLELEAVAGRFPIGQRVRFYPIAGDLNSITTAIRSAPWRLGHGEIVLKVAGRTGGVLISHLELIA